jgi:rare lipoprotein A
MQTRALLISALVAVLLTGCTTTPPGASTGEAAATASAPKPAPPAPPRKPVPAPKSQAAASEPALIPIPEPRPDAADSTASAEPSGNLVGKGIASWYGPGLHGRRTASGERFDSYEFTAAHRTLPFGTRVCVRSAITGKAVVVRINDRGPFSKGRVIDLSKAAAQELGLAGLGIKPVELWRLGSDEDTCPAGMRSAEVAGDDDAIPVRRHKARHAKAKPRKKRR